ncbi:GAP family protein [Halorientalis pallida]|uniref:Sap, sulfolipid-1-addressing protein n=1 Tax=Halorientalis pallida TaxID=2479928 RepID=A0A498L503_9EURY|nr:GAP family protein [Halorientalis pallida]RXK51724.1 hypothetical protein EAF64_03575 [Halorientalis pallida]
MSLRTVLPLAIVMVAGPQFLSAIFLATSGRWRRNSAAYLLGAALSISLVVGIVYVSGIEFAGGDRSRPVLEAVAVAAIVLAVGYVFWTRETAEPPEWMGRLGTASPRFSFRLGFLLLGFFPTDLLTSAAVGSFLAAEGRPWTDALGFVAATLLLLALPSLAVLTLGERAEQALPRVRDAMETNAWLVNEAVLLFFLVLVVT